MWINIGRLLMLSVWGVLLLNLLYPFPKPLNIFMNVAIIFMILMHGLQLWLFTATQPKTTQPLSSSQKGRLLLYGVFELLHWQKKLKENPPAVD